MSTDDPEITPAQVITRAWMAHLGYTPEQIAEGETDRDHSLCDMVMCVDENGVANHPIHDAMDDAGHLVMFVLEHPAAKEIR